MKRRSAVQVVLWSLAATAGCGSDAGPATPACSSALATQVVLAVGAYTSIDPASDAGCVTVAANASAVDSAEYLLVPQSASGSPAASSPFRLQAVSLQPTAPFAMATPPVGAPPSRRSAALSFDWFLRRAAASRTYGTPRAPSAAPRVALTPLMPAAPPALGSLRAFKSVRQPHLFRFGLQDRWGTGPEPGGSHRRLCRHARAREWTHHHGPRLAPER